MSPHRLSPRVEAASSTGASDLPDPAFGSVSESNRPSLGMLEERHAAFSPPAFPWLLLWEPSKFPASSTLDYFQGSKRQVVQS